MNLAAVEDAFVWYHFRAIIISPIAIPEQIESCYS